MAELTRQEIERFRAETARLREAPETADMTEPLRIRTGVAALAETILDGNITAQRAVLTLYFPTASMRIAAGAMLESMFGINPKDARC